MRKILASLLTLVFCSFISNSYAEIDSVNTKKYEEIDIKKYNHIDLGLSGLGLQYRYSYDITPYNELGFKISFGGIINGGSSNAGIDTGKDISLEDKAYFAKYSKYYSKDNSVVTVGSYIKTFVSLTKSNNIIQEPPFLAVGTGIGYDFLKNNVGFGIGLDVGSTLERRNNNALAGIIFFRPELNFKIVF